MKCDPASNRFRSPPPRRSSPIPSRGWAIGWWWAAGYAPPPGSFRRCYGPRTFMIAGMAAVSRRFRHVSRLTKPGDRRPLSEQVRRAHHMTSVTILGVRIAAALLWSLLFVPAAPAARTLDVYVIDVEGGKAVLLVSPSGESMLFDAGWPGSNGRDVNRIVEAVQAAGLKQIDYLVISHYDIDHLGDVPLLVSRIPVRHFVDHGPLQSNGKGAEARYTAYAEVRDKGDYGAVKPGDRIPIKGLDVTVVAAATKLLDKPLPGGGGANRLCATTPEKGERPEDLEDNMSIGLLFTLGKFRMLDMADLEWFYDRKLMCPNNPIGTVDVYQVSGVQTC